MTVTVVTWLVLAVGLVLLMALLLATLGHVRRFARESGVATRDLTAARARLRATAAARPHRGP